MAIVLNTSVMNITQGALIITGLQTFGAAGMQLRNQGLALAAAGQLELGFELYNLGGEIFGLGAHLIEVSTTAVELFSLGVAVTGPRKSWRWIRRWRRTTESWAAP